MTVANNTHFHSFVHNSKSAREIKAISMIIHDNYRVIHFVKIHTFSKKIIVINLIVLMLNSIVTHPTSFDVYCTIIDFFTNWRTLWKYNTPVVIGCCPLIWHTRQFMIKIQMKYHTLSVR